VQAGDGGTGKGQSQCLCGIEPARVDLAAGPACCCRGGRGCERDEAVVVELRDAGRQGDRAQGGQHCDPLGHGHTGRQSVGLGRDEPRVVQGRLRGGHLGVVGLEGDDDAVADPARGQPGIAAEALVGLEDRAHDADGLPGALGLGCGRAAGRKERPGDLGDLGEAALLGHDGDDVVAQAEHARAGLAQPCGSKPVEHLADGWPGGPADVFASVGMTFAGPAGAGIWSMTGGSASEPEGGTSGHGAACCGTPRVSLVCHSEVFPLLRSRSAKITQIYEGTNQVQRIVMARHLLSG
jgi:hypothetical protein